MNVAELFNDSPPARGLSTWSDALVQNQLAGYAFGLWKDQLSQEDAEKLRPYWKRQFARNQTHKAFLKKLSAHLEKEGISICLLKGMSLLDLSYHDYGMRSMSDIDVLVSAADRDSFLKILTDMGLVNFGAHKWKFNDYKDLYLLDDEAFPIFVEVHTKLFEHVPAPAKNHWRPYGMPEIFILNRVELCTHLIGHYFFQHTCLSLYWMVDIVLLFQKLSNEEREQVKALCFEWGLRRNWFALERVLNLVTDGQTGFSSKWYFSSLINNAFLLAPKTNLLKYFLVKHLLKDSFWESLRYNFYWVWSKGWISKN